MIGAGHVRRLVPAVAAAVLLCGSAGTAFAQASRSEPLTRKGKVFLVGGLISGPTSVGTANAELLNGAGEPSVTLFRVDNKLAIGYGLESAIGFQLTRSIWLEVAGSWTSSKLESEIRNDFEDAFDETISSTMSRFAVEGAFVKFLSQKAGSGLFVRVSGGWMRETAGGATLTGDGTIGSAGLGWRHWWNTNARSAVRRMGLRVEGRGVIRSGGISLGEKGIRFGPAGAAHLVFGF